VFGRKILGLNRSIEPDQAEDLSFDLKAALA
jgi:3-phenylpropionate/trans-cinnamate dioxygenase ferredoxin reductase subunit